MALLDIENLTLSYGVRPVLKSLSFGLERGEVLALCGESGSGKSSTALALMRLLPKNAQVGGCIRLDGADLTAMTERQLQAVRGKRIGLVFQDATAALNPVRRIGAQIAETLAVHAARSRVEIRRRVEAVMARVGLTDAGIGPDRFPHQLSGGQCQRVAIAMAIAAKPSLIVADEPTTALDVSLQAQILDLLRRLTREDGCGLILITHDLGVVAEYADRVALMADGAIVESGPVATVFRQPKSTTAVALIAGATAPPVRAATVAQGEILRVAGVCHRYNPRGAWALDNIGFALRRGESLGIVGESGSGKTTLLQIVLGLTKPAAGTVELNGRSWLSAQPAALAAMRRQVQAVFQNPLASFDPRHRVARIVAEPLHLSGRRLSHAERAWAVDAVLDKVGLSSSAGRRYPREFSGGQRQRIAIARALILSPSLIVFDEALSALDAAARSDLLTLLNDLSVQAGLSYLFVTHDLDQARAITDRVIVMQRGKIVEMGATAQVLSCPKHPYTAELLAAAPDLGRALARG